MYISKYDIARKITDYQLELIIMLKMGYTIVTNEGSNFKVWLEKDGVKVEGVSIRKDSGDKILSWGLMEIDNCKGYQRNFYYKESEKAEDVLNIVENKRIENLKVRVFNKLKRVV